MPGLRVFPLREDQLACAYPLVRSSLHGPQAEWEAFARSVMADGGGVLAVKANGDCLYGVATYRTHDTLRDGLVLDVETLVAVDLSIAAPVRRELHQKLECIARGRGCRSIRITPPRPGGANRARA